MALIGRNLLRDFTSSRSHRTCVYKCGDSCHRPVENTSANPYFTDIARKAFSRRDALRAGSAAIVTVSGASVLAACADGSSSGGSSSSSAATGSDAAATTAGGGEVTAPAGMKFDAVKPNTEDAVVIPEGYEQSVLISWGDPVIAGAPAFDVDKQTPDAAAKQYGFNNDFAALLPVPNEAGRYLLVSNHEYSTPQAMFRDYDAKNPTADQVAIEQASHGLSVVEVMDDGKDGGLKVVPVDEATRYNRRLHLGTTFEIVGPLAGNDAMKTSADPTGRYVSGTLNNCAGGVTPWGTILSGEENCDQYFGGGAEVAGKDEGLGKKYKRYGINIEENDTERGWEKHDNRFDLRKEPNEPNRFNWIVELDPWDPNSTPIKHTPMGRFKHEGANVHVTGDGTVVAYSGDDSRFEYLYKFVSSRKLRSGTSPEDRRENMKILSEGTLYVASFTGNSDDIAPAADGSHLALPKDGAYDGTGTWIKLATSKEDGSVESHVDGMSGEEVLLYTRLAGDKVGATKLDRPEDVEAHPSTGRVYAALTNNKYRGTGKTEGGDLAEWAPVKENKNGYVLEIDDKHTGTDFGWNLLLVCGDPKEAETYFGGVDKSQVSPISCPDNLAFDSAGNLWVSTDGNALKSNDGLFAVSLEGPSRGLTKQFLTVPIGAETCGPIVTDRRVLVNVQHPGEDDDATIDTMTSSWPGGKGTVPRPSTVVVWKKGDGTIGS